MNIILWIVFGGLAGWIASLVMGKAGQQGLLMDIVLGVVGAIIGGFIMNLFGQPCVSGFNIYSLIVAVVGAVALIAIGRILNRGEV